MTNQQVVPEALRTIRRFYRGTDCMAENQAGDWVRYEDHVAALVEAQQPAQPSAAADTVVLEAALRAIHQAIDLIGEPDTERLRTVRRVLRGAVVVAEDCKAPQADIVLEDAARLDWLALAGPTSICLVIDRPHDGEVEVATDDVTGYGKTLREAIDAAMNKGGAT